MTAPWICFMFNARDGWPMEKMIISWSRAVCECLLPPEQQSTKTKSKCGNICSYKIEKYTALSKLQDVSNAIKYTILPEYSNVCSWYNHCMPLSASYIYTCMLHVLLCTFDTFAARHTNDRVYNVHASNQCWQTAFRGWFYFFFHTPNTTYAAFGFVDYISLFCIRYFGRKSGLSELSAVSDMKL